MRALFFQPLSFTLVAAKLLVTMGSECETNAERKCMRYSKNTFTNIADKKYNYYKLLNETLGNFGFYRSLLLLGDVNFSFRPTARTSLSGTARRTSP